MSDLTDFPDEYPLVKAKVAAIDFHNPLDQGYEDIDIFVRMNDGRSYLFTPCTPEFFRLKFEEDAEAKSYVTSGMLVVREISIDCMLDALEHVLYNDHVDSMSLDHYGVLQQRIDDN